MILGGCENRHAHTRVLCSPTPLDTSTAFTTQGGTQRRCPSPLGRRHWDIFQRLRRAVGARGNLVPRCISRRAFIRPVPKWTTTDQDYARFRASDGAAPLRGGARPVDPDRTAKATRAGGHLSRIFWEQPPWRSLSPAWQDWRLEFLPGCLAWLYPEGRVPSTEDVAWASLAIPGRLTGPTGRARPTRAFG